MNTRTRPAILRFAVLSRAEQTIFLRALCLLPIMACAPAIFRWQKVQSWVERHDSRCNKNENANGTDPSVIERMVFSAARYGIIRGNCLSRSLTLCYLLKCEGYNACLRLGGRRRGESFEAHAWVELEDRAFDAPDDLRKSFAPFPVNPSNELISPK